MSITVGQSTMEANQRGINSSIYHYVTNHPKREWLKQSVVFIFHKLAGQLFEQSTYRMACSYSMMPETSALIIRMAENWNSCWLATYFSLSSLPVSISISFLHPLHVASFGFLI